MAAVMTLQRTKSTGSHADHLPVKRREVNDQRRTGD
jgi:hypothetical protein